jgi:arylsulfatase A-like enzyme
MKPPLTTFLDYYYWMQSSVDYHLGRVIQGIKNNTSLWNSTVLILTSDHGEYGGSHNLKAKGGAMFEESLNVPL